MPLNIHTPFLENLAAMPKSYKNLSNYADLKNVVKKIVITKEVKQTAVAHLNKMNITAETLFPGIDGFARSLTQTELYV